MRLTDGRVVGRNRAHLGDLLLLFRCFREFLTSSVTAVTAFSMPRFRLIGSWPAATILAPSVQMARARTVAVVVPGLPRC